MKCVISLVDALVEKAWKYHGIPWKKHGENSMEILELHGNPVEQHTMESMGYLPCFFMLAWENDYMESMEKAWIAWIVKPWNSMEFHGKAWGKFHGNPSEQHSMESMGDLPCFPC